MDLVAFSRFVICFEFIRRIGKEEKISFTWTYYFMVNVLLLIIVRESTELKLEISRFASPAPKPLDQSALILLPEQGPQSHVLCTVLNRKA